MTERAIQTLERQGCEICGGRFVGGIFTNAADEIVCLQCFKAFIPTDGGNFPRLPEERVYA